MRVHLAGDHAAYDLKTHLAQHLAQGGHEVVDHGPTGYDAEDDYPVFVLRAAEAVAADPGALALVLGGSGNGEQIAANRVPGVRAALGWSLETARLARQHNDANALGVGARMHTLQEATAIVDAFLAEPFSGEERHARRIAMLTRYEQDHELPPLPGRLA
ncbi:ribose-5-phosphate isomerase [Quadrisphaera sp. DSM 44207]|uniref:ribose-5-phosphate isomerase n=1 Tax=Quadrisphaera sp. DSM 44207 TaxID=1881057 RepID=UPI000891EB10|nr:ribose-5-phosphate isomerase [Quadrisphaera sp. DSM 44207]SDQ06113.1 ribose 5-phosphate isomerase B [Quadrisphaera sp. DSM 44207]